LTLPDPLADTLQKVTFGNPKYAPFGDALGAVDGSFIPIQVLHRDYMRFMSRKGYTAMNFLAACTFRFRFFMVELGLEGAASDSTCFERFMKERLDDLLGQRYYLLGDAIFRNSLHVLTPYRGFIYHLQDWKGEDIDRVPQNKYELFNLRHAQLRNIIERIFGAMKSKFRILGQRARLICDVRKPDYIDSYSKIMAAITLLFNDMRSAGEITCEDFKKRNINNVLRPNADADGEIEQDSDENDRNDHGAAGLADANGDFRRERIANELWEQFQQENRHMTARSEIAAVEHTIAEMFDIIMQ
jgi:hypothetical protein